MEAGGYGYSRTDEGLVIIVAIIIAMATVIAILIAMVIVIIRVAVIALSMTRSTAIARAMNNMSCKCNEIAMTAMNNTNSIGIRNL